MKKQHILHFIVLVGILTGGVTAFILASSSSSLQLIIGIITSVAYVLWGFIHHAMQKDLHKKIVVEYVLIGAIAIIMLATILQR
jgi:hypothetical protein